MTEPGDSMIIRPESGDTVTANEVLDDVCKTLAKHGYAIVHRHDAMLLIKVLDDVTMQGRAIAYVRQITPRFHQTAPINWATAAMAPKDMSKKAQ